MQSTFDNIMRDITDVLSFFLENIITKAFSFIISQPLFFILLMCFCLMACIILLLDFLIDHNHLFSEYMKDSSEKYVHDRKQREKEAEREAKNEARREKYRLQNKADFIEKQNIIKQTQKDIYFDKKSGYENIKPSYDIEKAIEKAENEPLVYRKKTKKE